jgi:hypothetical protein
MPTLDLTDDELTALLVAVVRTSRVECRAKVENDGLRYGPVA